MFDWVLKATSQNLNTEFQWSQLKTQSVVGCCYSFWLSRLFTCTVYFFSIISIVNYLIVLLVLQIFSALSGHDVTFMQFRSAEETLSLLNCS